MTRRLHTEALAFAFNFQSEKGSEIDWLCLKLILNYIIQNVPQSTVRINTGQKASHITLRLACTDLNMGCAPRSWNDVNRDKQIFRSRINPNMTFPIDSSIIFLLILETNNGQYKFRRLDCYFCYDGRVYPFKIHRVYPRGLKESSDCPP